jgi:hydroxyisourate hydrolase
LTLVTTHVLDTTVGSPAVGLAVTLEAADATGRWTVVSSSPTDSGGRVKDFPPVTGGRYRLLFDTRTPFFPEVAVTFNVNDEEHLHVPLLLSPFGYSVYRGS